MCGIAGILDYSGSEKAMKPEIVRKMTRVQRYRGPDGYGFYSDPNIALGHARLAIIDLSENARQPVSNEDNTLFLVHNGEIYNYVELRGELEDAGHVFKTKSDSEVILHGYEEWGTGCLGRFNGMWAFALWDTRKKSLFCARDRMGKKPFYYFYDGKNFVFSSEIKAMFFHPALTKIPDDQTIYNYLSTGYGYTDVSEDTFFKGIKRLREGHFALIKNGSMKIERYWDIAPPERFRERPVGEITEEFNDIFRNAVKIRMRSDVDVGLALSGGLDSSAIACAAAGLGAKKIKTFSSCFGDRRFDERNFIEPVLETTGFEPNFVFSGTEDAFGLLKRIIWHQDEPFISMGFLPQWNIFRAAKEKGIKVLLTGQGGDETLAGYHKYYPYLFAELIKKADFSSLAKELSLYGSFHGRSKFAGLVSALRILASYSVPRGLKDASGKFYERSEAYLAGKFRKKYRRDICAAQRFGEILNDGLYRAFKISPLPSLLRSDDRSGMAHSVESRSPFLDFRLVEFFFSLPSAYKIRDGYTKYVLRESMKGVLPECNRLRKDKKGFPVPAGEWFRGELRESIFSVLNSARFSGRGYFDAEKVRGMFLAHAEGRGDFTSKIWSILNLELWFRVFMEGEGIKSESEIEF